ncbi:MAG TPA: hypothetical protein VMU06_16065 [Stellaceae bacterium]|nr:hypothetical protein [Stellaceae bacterium]
MNHSQRVRIAIAWLLSLLSVPIAASAQSGPGPIDVKGVYVNPASGMTFPLAVGEFTRSGLFRFDRNERDVSASYNLVSGPSGIVATVYVYPSPMPPASNRSADARAEACRGEMERRKQEIDSYRPGAVLIAERDTELQQGGRTYPGRLAIFEFEASFRGQTQMLHSELYVFCSVADSWAFEYRFTAPKAFDYAGPIAAFMRGLPWTVHPAQ